MHSSLKYTGHRPWPLPSEPWVMQQQWLDLAFMHWEIPVRNLRDRIPPGLEIDTFDGTAWIGLVPFVMKGVRPRWCPSFPAFSEFPEINVRTYVTYQGKPGVWFFSLDVPNPLAVLVARSVFHLPYYLAQMDVQRRGNGVDYASRFDRRSFRAYYAPSIGKPIKATSFAEWATARYCLYTDDRKGRLYRGEIHHRSWPLEAAQLDVCENSYLDGFPFGQAHDEVLFSRSLEVVVWPLRRLQSDT